MAEDPFTPALKVVETMMSKGLGDLFKDIDELLQPAEEFVEEIGK